MKKLLQRPSAIVALIIGVLLLAGFWQGGGPFTTLSQPVVFTNGGGAVGPSAVFRNIGQASHWLIYCPSGSPTSVQIQLEGSADNATYYQISEIGTQTSGCGILEAGGYWNNVRANIIALSGGVSPTITATYMASIYAIPGGGLTRNQKTSQPVTIIPSQPYVNTALKSTGSSVLSTAGAIFGGTVQNTTNGIVYLLVQDAGQTLTTSTITQAIPANTANSGIINLVLPAGGVQFTTSATASCTTSLSAATDPATGCVVNLWFKPGTAYGNNINVGGTQSGPKPVAPPI